MCLLPRITISIFLVLFFATPSDLYAVPNSVSSPVSGPIVFGPQQANTWAFNQHGGTHYAGIGGTNDNNAWDINFGFAGDDECSDGTQATCKTVYAIEDGCIHDADGWGGDTYGQLLLNHTTNGEEWSSGYLHMINKTIGPCVSKGDAIGLISNTSPDNISDHLHFAIYDSHGQLNMTSVDVTITAEDYNNEPDIDVYAFSIKPDPVCVSKEGNNFYASSRVKNNSSNSITIDNMSIAIHLKSGAFYKDCWLKGTATTIEGSGTFATGKHSCQIPLRGEFEAVAKLFIDNEWRHMASKSFRVLSETECQNKVNIQPTISLLLGNRNAASGTVISAGQVWMDRNLGTSLVGNSSTDSAAYGDLYQWGRLSDGHEKRSSPTTSINSSTNIPGHDSFILESSSPIDWRVPQNDSLWQGVSGTNNPCPSGFRLPTATELNIERTSWRSNDSAGAFESPLKLVMAGNRIFLNGALFNAGSVGYYWSSTVSGSSNSYLNVTTSDANMYSNFRAYGYSVRCIKD